MGEGILPALVLFGAAGVWLLSSRWGRRERGRLWREAAERALTGLREERALGSTLSLTGWAGPLHVRFEHGRWRKREAATRITVSGYPGLTLRRAGPEGAWAKLTADRDIEVGDEDFDREVVVSGEPEIVRSILNAGTRRRLRPMLAGSLSVGDGTSLGARIAVRSGALCAELSDAECRGQPARLAGALESLLDVARRFRHPVDVVGRIAKNIRRDPEWRARVNGLQFLAERYPKHVATRQVLTRALGDEHAEVRLRAALALGEDGWKTLLELAVNETGSRAARALTGLGENLPVERGVAILGDAIRRGDVEAARSCLESFGRAGGAAVVGPLAKVLAEQDEELASAAARALGTSGADEAEAPLLHALMEGSSPVGAAAAAALGHVGSPMAVLPLKEAAEREGATGALRRAAREAVAEIQSRLQGASPGQLSIAEGATGQLSLADEDPAGRISLPDARKDERSKALLR